LKVTLKAHGAVVEINVRRRFFVGYFFDELGQAMLRQPLFDMGIPSHCEDDNVVTELVQPLQEVASAWARRMKEVGALPAVELIQYSIEINTND